MANLGHPGNWDAKSVVDVPRSSPLLLIVFCTGITKDASPLSTSQNGKCRCVYLFSPLSYTRASLASSPRHPRITFDLTASWRGGLCRHAR